MASFRSIFLARYEIVLLPGASYPAAKSFLVETSWYFTYNILLYQ